MAEKFMRSEASVSFSIAALLDDLVYTYFHNNASEAVWLLCACLSLVLYCEIFKSNICFMYFSILNTSPISAQRYMRNESMNE